MAKANFQNRTLYHGDNLEFLRGMNSGTVHLIATDPPFNKNKDFHATPDSLATGAKFTDRWSWEKDIHEEWVDGIKDDWPGVWKVIEAARIASGDDMAAFLCWLGVRLMAMHRVLRDDGSIYLHCDPTASHYLKTIMDAIFGKKNFRNEIIWSYGGPSRSNVAFPSKHDNILFYSKSKAYQFNPQYGEVPNYMYKRANKDPDGRLWVDQRLGVKEERLEQYRNEGRTFITKTGGERLKQYLDEMDGILISSVWSIPIINSQSKERTGYPTQKPLALYERIIKASSYEGDIVLDPFAGCATTLVAAERLGRQWVGMDIWRGAKGVVLDRLQAEGLATPKGAGGLLAFGDVHYSTKASERTDDNEVAAPNLKLKVKRPVEPWEKMSHKQMSNVLADAQRGGDGGLVICAGCGRALEKEFMELDHIKPKTDGGKNHIPNRILLCGPCNKTKSGYLTLSGLIRENNRKGWMENKDLAVSAQEKANDKAEWVQYNFDTDECKALMQEG